MQCIHVHLCICDLFKPLILPAASPICGHVHQSAHQMFSLLYLDSVEPRKRHAVLIKSFSLMKQKSLNLKRFLNM